MSNEALMFPVAKNIQLGDRRPHDLLRDLDEKFYVTGVARAMLKGPWPEETFASCKVAMNLCFATAEQITGSQTPTIQFIYEEICAKGYSLCPAEVGPQLRLQYPEQPKGEELWIAMRPIPTASGAPQMFGIVHGDLPKPGTLALRAYYCLPNMMVQGSSKWAFIHMD